MIGRLTFNCMLNRFTIARMLLSFTLAKFHWLQMSQYTSAFFDCSIDKKLLWTFVWLFFLLFRLDLTMVCNMERSWFGGSYLSFTSWLPAYASKLWHQCCTASWFGLLFTSIFMKSRILLCIWSLDFVNRETSQVENCNVA